MCKSPINKGRLLAGDRPSRPIGRGGRDQRKPLASSDSPSPCASLGSLISPVWKQRPSSRKKKGEQGEILHRAFGNIQKVVIFRQVTSAMESVSKASSGGKTGLAEVAKVDEPAKTGKLNCGMTAITFVVGAILGAALGAGVASHVLESEFSEFRKHRFPPHSSPFMYADKA